MNIIYAIRLYLAGWRRGPKGLYWRDPVTKACFSPAKAGVMLKARGK